MNRWVREKTEGKIADVLSPEKLQDVSLVVLNAIYFKGAWAEPFSEGMTTPLPFYLGSTGSVTAQVMDQEAHFHYFENPELKALELPYVGGKMSMVILLPKLKEGLPDLETSLSADKLSVWINLMRAEDVIVQMPKFKMEKQFELTPTLNEMGLRDALCSKADFSGITSPGGLYVSAVSHKSFVEVNEKGTEAAAVTAAWAAFGNVEKPAPKTFFANHPFLFLIRDNGTGSILFMGRVMDPTK
jgi:serpin B